MPRNKTSIPVFTSDNTEDMANEHAMARAVNSGSTVNVEQQGETDIYHMLDWDKKVIAIYLPQEMVNLEEVSEKQLSKA